MIPLLAHLLELYFKLRWAASVSIDGISYSADGLSASGVATICGTFHSQMVGSLPDAALGV